MVLRNGTKKEKIKYWDNVQGVDNKANLTRLKNPYVYGFGENVLIDS